MSLSWFCLWSPGDMLWMTEKHALLVVENVDVIRKILNTMGRKDRCNSYIYDVADRYVEPTTSTLNPGQAIDISPMPVPRSSKEAKRPRTRRRVNPVQHVVPPVHKRLHKQYYGPSEDTGVCPSQSYQPVFHEYSPAQLYVQPGPKYHVSLHHVPYSVTSTLALDCHVDNQSRSLTCETTTNHDLTKTTSPTTHLLTWQSSSASYEEASTHRETTSTQHLRVPPCCSSAALPSAATSPAASPSHSTARILAVADVLSAFDFYSVLQLRPSDTRDLACR
ncbi:hypothetical protein Fmac_001026 [Flemingia macrophylla]|uniref:Uncharacterized protein n=1 Tax=Flemingia macrophylla TaxID=520843 RepID=A0ABD1NGE6_9FABA